MTTRRERLERKVELRAEWAEKARARSAAAFNGAQRIADVIPLGQPILVGHHSEGHHRRDLARIDSGMRRGVENQQLAKHHESAGAGLARQLEHSIYSDDPDAIEQIEARIAENKAKRERMKTINQLYRKGDAAGLQALGLDLEKLRARPLRGLPALQSRSADQGRRSQDRADQAPEAAHAGGRGGRRGHGSAPRQRHPGVRNVRREAGARDPAGPARLRVLVVRLLLDRAGRETP